MKIAILGIFITSLFSFSAMAAPFVVEKVGKITWTVKDDECNSSTLDISQFQKKLYPEDKNLVGGPSNSSIMRLLLKIPSSGLSTQDVTFDYSEKGSKEQVQDIISMALVNEMHGLDIEAKSVSLDLESVDCQEKGLFKRELVCSAYYTGKVFIDL